MAGPELSPSAFHCAIVGVRDAIEGYAQTNADHWKAARAGDRGYRLPDPVIIPGMGDDRQPMPKHQLARSSQLPDELSIPDFLLRQPHQNQMRMAA